MLKRKLLILATTVLFFASFASANGDKVSFQVQLDGVQVGNAPLYISVQDAGKFRTQSGNAGTILRSQDDQLLTVDLEVEPGKYAVSIWHDLDEDGKFSINERYIPTDGWGSSGTPPKDRAPSFDEMMVEIYQDGQVVFIEMQYVSD